jgi:hypothetical protein
MQGFLPPEIEEYGARKGRYYYSLMLIPERKRIVLLRLHYLSTVHRSTVFSSFVWLEIAREQSAEQKNFD